MLSDIVECTAPGIVEVLQYNLNLCTWSCVGDFSECNGGRFVATYGVVVELLKDFSQTAHFGILSSSRGANSTCYGNDCICPGL